MYSTNEFVIALSSLSVFHETNLSKLKFVLNQLPPFYGYKHGYFNSLDSATESAGKVSRAATL